MFPSKKDGNYGIFVEKIYNQILKSDFFNKIDLNLIKGRKTNFLFKLLAYFKFYLVGCFLLNFRKYDIVYFHSLPFSIPQILLAKNKPGVIIHLHGSELKNSNKFILLLSEFSLRQISKYRVKFILPSNFFKTEFLNFLEERNIKIDQSTMFISPSGGVDSSFFYDKKVFNSFKSRKLKIGYFSRLVKEKGIYEFLDFAKSTSDQNLEFLIVGDGPDFKYVDPLIRHYDHIKLNKSYSQSDIIRGLRQVDVVLFLTHYEESLGLIGLETMASKAVLVAPARGGVATYLQNQINGFELNVFNRKNILNSINSLRAYEDQKLLNLINSAYQTASLYKDEVVKEKLIDYIISN